MRAFPDSGAKWLVSGQGGGTGPQWRGDGKELFYLSPVEGKLMAVAVREKAGVLEWDTPRPLFPIFGAAEYDVASDGQHFLMLQPPEDDKSLPLTVVINWQAELAK